MDLPKLFIVTRRDLKPGVRAAQLCHGMRQWSAEQPEADRQWFEKSNTLVLLEVGDEPALHRIARSAHEAGVACVRFHEPDMDNELTAVAISPAGSALVAQLPLALRSL